MQLAVTTRIVLSHGLTIDCLIKLQLVGFTWHAKPHLCVCMCGCVHACTVEEVLIPGDCPAAFLARSLEAVCPVFFLEPRRRGCSSRPAGFMPKYQPFERDQIRKPGPASRYYYYCKAEYLPFVAESFKTEYVSPSLPLGGGRIWSRERSAWNIFLFLPQLRSPSYLTVTLVAAFPPATTKQD